MQMLLAIPGVTAARMSETANQLPMATASAQPTQQFFDSTIVTSNPTVLSTGFLPTGHLFKPLLADPRWAHFSAAYRNFQNNSFDGRRLLLLASVKRYRFTVRILDDLLRNGR